VDPVVWNTIFFPENSWMVWKTFQKQLGLMDYSGSIDFNGF